MSERVVELPSAASPGGRSGGTAEFERTPPQDIAAEQSVLGGMLLSKDAIADVVEVLRSNDFYRPAHQTIFDVIVDLYGRGEPADAVTVSAELTRRGEIGRVGGGPYLHTLLASVPTAANAGFYARIVAEQAILRRLVEAGTRIVQLGYGAAGNGDVDDIVDRAQQSVYEVTERRTSEDYTLLEELMQPTLDELEAIGSRGGSMTGVPTGFADLDALTNGLHAGQLVVIAARPGVGKALALDTPLPTPTGWTTMGRVQPGDQLLGADGQPTTVVRATDVLLDRPCYEVEFSDGTVLVADAAHEWVTSTTAERRRGLPGAVRTTEQIAHSVRRQTPDSRGDHAVRVAAPLRLPERQLPVPPYALGVWLGQGDSGSARFPSEDPEVCMHIEAEGLVVVPAAAPPGARLALPPVPDSQEQARGNDHDSVPVRLRSLGVLGDKHVPSAYLRASERQRRDLLAGVLDTHATVTASGSVEIVVASERLALSLHELVLSLGYRCSWTTQPGSSPASPSRSTLTFTTDDDVFRVERKRLLHKERRGAAGGAQHRFIVDVRRVPSVPVRCVEVSNADHLYLAGRTMVPTHNSTLGLDIARACSIKHGLGSVLFSLEMSKTEITMRLLSAEARVPLQHMRSGTMTDDDWARLARRMGEVAEAPLFIDDSPNMTMMEIRAKARRLKQRHDIRLVIVDYLQLMTGNKKAESRQQEVSELSRSLKLLAKELDCPVVAMSQLNRGPEQRTDKKPQLSDLRESGAIEQDADIVILLYREDMIERESPRAGEADFIVAKHRNGQTGTVTVSSQLHYARFVDMASG